MTQRVLWVSDGQLVTWAWRQEREDFLEAERLASGLTQCLLIVHVIRSSYKPGQRRDPPPPPSRPPYTEWGPGPGCAAGAGRSSTGTFEGVALGPAGCGQRRQQGAGGPEGGKVRGAGRS